MEFGSLCMVKPGFEQVAPADTGATFLQRRGALVHSLQVHEQPERNLPISLSPFQQDTLCN